MEFNKEEYLQKSFDEVIKELQTIVETLEVGNLPLEKSIELFEKGVKLVKVGSEKLDAVEKRVEILLKQEGKEMLTEFNPEPPPK